MPADPTDAALGRFIRKLIHDGGELHVRYPTEDGYSEQRIHIEDRVVAGRPDQPTHTTLTGADLPEAQGPLLALGSSWGGDTAGVSTKSNTFDAKTTPSRQ